jgi:MtN3 and saliva related transmembrane protein
MIEMEKIFGWIATGLSLIYKIPQIVKLYKTKEIGSLSFMSLICQLLSYSFYIVHGIIIDDMPIIVMGSISIVQSILLVAMYIYYR